MVDRRRPPGPVPETCSVDTAMDVRRRTCQTIYQQDQCLGICRGSSGVLPSGSLQEAAQPYAKLMSYREVRAGTWAQTMRIFSAGEDQFSGLRCRQIFDETGRVHAGLETLRC
jgi:hypothetical protein